MLAQVVVSKFAEHVPLYRFEDISTRYGLYLPRTTLCDWVGNVAELLKPLYELEKELVRTAPVIWTDDTHVTVLGGEEPGSHKGRFWVYIGPTALPYDVYDFTEDRKRRWACAVPGRLCGLSPSRCLQRIRRHLRRLRRPDHRSGLLGACASEVLRGAVVVSGGSIADPADDPAALRS